MINEFGIFSSKISVREYQCRTLGFVTAHSEDTSLCVLTWLTDTVVILLFVSKFKGIYFISTFSNYALWFNLLKLHEVSNLRTKEESSLSRNGDVINIAHRSLSIDRSIEGYST